MTQKDHSNNYQLRDNLFILPSTGRNKIVYAPLQGYSFFCTPKDVHEIAAYIKNGTPISDNHLNKYLKTIEEEEIEYPNEAPSIIRPNRLLIILSQQCNLACSYCYAHESRSKQRLDLNIIFTGVDYLLSYDENDLKVFTFIGGGEPFVTWNLLEESIYYIEKKANERNIKYQIRIVTNGTLITEEKAQWLSNKNVVISLSFDILPDIQDKQRSMPHGISSHAKVAQGIDVLRKNKIPFIFRSTITHLNVGRMLEMAKTIYASYPEIRRLHFEPVTDDSIDNQLFFKNYIVSFFKTIHFCEANNLFLTNSYINSFEHIKNNMCQAEMCLTPDGSIVACHRHSSDDDPIFEKLKYGFIKDGKMVMEQSSISNVISIRNERFDDCSSCFAKWHCAGACTSKKLVYSEKNRYLHCEFTRDILNKYIEHQLKLIER